jgi:hypothetical protein
LLYTAAIAAQDRPKPLLKNDSAARDKVIRLGFGQRVNVKLQNGTSAAGRVTELAEDHFVVTDGKGSATKIPYEHVARIAKQKEKLRIFEKPFAAFATAAAYVGTFVVLTMDFFR